jgi:3-oxoacyl-[acyl-carrier protein] reductase
MQVAGKVALVTGGGTGVGAATALHLAKLGCAVAVNYSRSKDAAEQIAERARAAGVRAIALRADVSRDDECRRLVSECVTQLGRLDILVNNAGTTSFIPHHELEKVSDDDWNTILGVNLKGPFFCSRAARPHLSANGSGEIVMTSSVAGIAGVGSSIPYCASKAALNNLVVTLARVMGPHVRVNAVAPGFIDGEWLQQGLGPAYAAIRKAVQEKSPLQRVCTPDDVADAIVSLITGSDLVTGNVLPVEGGMLIAR